jgi:hypothetical protein
MTAMVAYRHYKKIARIAAFRVDRGFTAAAPKIAAKYFIVIVTTKR